MRFEWDEAKRRENVRKHGIDFVGAGAVFEGYTATREDIRLDYGEQRLVTFGLLEGRVVAIVHTEQADVIRFISIRKATRHEKKSYLAEIPD